MSRTPGRLRQSTVTAVLRLGAALLLAVAVATCSDEHLGGPSRGGAGYFAFRPVTQLSAPPASFGIVIDSVHIRLTRPPTNLLVLDTTAAFPADSSALKLALLVPLSQQAETLTATIELKAAGAVVFSGTQDVVVVNGPPGTSPPPSITLAFVGPGKTTDSIRISPRDTAIKLGDSLRFQASAWDSSGAALTQFYAGWKTSDTTLAKINATGLLRAPTHRGTVRIIATTPTGIADTTSVTFVPTATLLARLSGDGQAATVGTSPAAPLVVQARAADSLGVAGVAVRFRALAAGAAVAESLVVTDSLGHAATAVTLGPTAGPQRFVAQAGTLAPDTFTVTGGAGAAAAIAIQAGNAQSDTTDLALPTPFTVKVTDAFGNAAAGAKVAWVRVAGRGALATDTTTSDSTGLAAVGYTLGAIAGTDTVSATLAGTTAKVTFTATAVTAAAASVTIVSGNAQSDTVGRALVQPLVVFVADARGKLVAGARVIWSAKSGGGTFSPDTAFSDTTGHAQTSYTAGSAAGTDTLVATIACGCTATFTATALPAAASAIAIQGGNAQTDTVGTALPAALAVKVTDAFGNPVDGATVNWTVVTGGGSLSAASTVTAGGGLAQVTYTLGTVPAADSVKATLGAGPAAVTFTATTVAPAPTAIAVASGNAQTDTVGKALALPLVVSVTGAGSKPVAGTRVAFSVKTGSGTFGALAVDTVTTDTLGHAKVSFTLGATAGTDSVLAKTVTGGFTVTFAETAVAAAPSVITIVSGNTQSDTALGTLAQPLTARVTDAQLNAVAGARVIWTVASGTGTFSGLSVDTVTTAANGQASVAFTLGATAGADSVRATIQGTSASVTFVATATSGSAAAIGIVSGNTQTDTAGVALPSPFVVRVADGSNNPVAGVKVYWTRTAGTGTLSADSTVTNASGQTQVAFTLGTAVGTDTIKAALAGGASTLFTAAATAGAPAAIAASGGAGQSGTTGSVLPNPLTVRVTDAHSNPVPGVTVTWAVTAGGGSLAGVTGTTDATGTSTAAQWTLGGTAGTDSATATLAGVSGSPVIFTAVALPLAATKSWTGSAGTSWATAGSWNPSGVPTTSDNVYIPASAPAPVVAATTTVGGLQTETGVTLTISAGDTLSTLGTVLLPSGATVAGSGILALAGTNQQVSGAFGGVAVTGTPLLSGASTVSGPLTVTSAGALTLNGHPLAVGGAFSLAGNGRLVMTNSADSLDVGGLFTANGAATGTDLTAGTLVLRGGFAQGTSFTNNFAPSATHTTVFAGTGAQSVTFAYPGLTQSHFGTLVVNDGAGITLGSGVAATGTVTLTSGAVTGTGRTGILGGGLVDASALWHVDSTTLAATAPAPLPDSITGQVTVTGTIALATALKVNGGLTLAGSGRLTPAGHPLSVTGTMTLTGSSQLVMTNALDTVNVGGLFTANGGQTGANLSAGKLVLRGGFTQGSSFTDNFAPTGTHQTVFAGAAAQTVNFYSPAAAASRFQDVVFNDAGGVTFATPVAVNGSATVLAGTVSGASQAATIGGNLADASGAGWQVGTTIFTGSPTSIPDSIAGNVAVQGALTLAKPLLVQGTLALTNSGTLTVNGHRLAVTGAISTSNSSHLLMRNAADTVDAGGGFSANGGADNHDYTNGLLIVRGAFAQGNNFTTTFAAESLHVTRFAGTAPQNVAFTYPLNSHFQNVEFANPAGVTFTTDVAANGTATITAGSVIGTGRAGTIGADLVDATNSAWKVDTTIFTGSPVLPDSFSGVVHFQGAVTLAKALKVIGSVAVDGTGGVLTLGGHPLTVTGAFATGGSGHLKMALAADSLDVGGAYTANGATSTGDLTAGVIVLRGNFTQGNAFSDNFAPSGTHRVRFVGSAAQSVSFSYPLNSHFQDAEFDDPAGVSFASAATVAGTATVLRGVVTAAGHGVTVGAGLADTSNASWRPDTTILAGAPASLPDSIQSTVDVTGTLALAKALRVKGALLVTGSGVLQPSGHPLAVTGALATANSARFVMTNAADSVDVGGAFTANGASSTGDLTAGVLVLRGNFSQGTSSGTGFAASGTHRTRFLGAAAQALSFAYPATSHFQDVEFANAAGVTAASGFAVAGTAAVTSGTVTGTGRAATLTAALADAGGNGWHVDTTFFTAAPTALPDSIHGTVHFQAGVTLAKRLRIVGGALVDGASGNLVPAGHAFVATGALQVQNGAQLQMTNPLDTVDVGGFRISTSASGAGLDTTGILVVRGSFVQTAGSNLNFQPSGGHVTELVPTGADTVSLVSPNLTQSRFNTLVVAPAAGSIVLASDVPVAGTFRTLGGTAPTLLGGGHQLMAGGLDVSSLTLDSLALTKFGAAQVVRFDSVTFQHMDPAGTQLALSESGATGQQVFTDVRFTTPPTTGKYLQVADSATNGYPVTLAFDRSFPLNGSAATAVVNGNDGAVIKWTTLVFAPGPQNDTTGVVLAPAIRAVAVGPIGDTVTTFADTVTVAIGTNPVGGTLSGTLKRAAVGGVATFNDLIITGVGNGYTLTAGTPQLPTLTSPAFNIGIFVPAGTSAIWSGTTDSVWTTASNWQGGVVPDSASNVLIPSGTAHAPVVQMAGTARVNRLTLQSGTTLAIDSLATLYADSSVSNAGSITGMGTLSLKGAGTVSGTLGGVQVTGNYAVDPASSFNASGNLTILGAGARLDLNGRRGFVGRTLLVTSSGLLVMTHAADTLDVALNAQFSGGNEAGLLTGGVLAVAGNFTEGFGDPHAFAASGAHLTRLDGASGTATVHFGDPDTAKSHFAHLDLAGSDSVSFDTLTYALGNFSVSNTGITAVGKDTLVVGGNVTTAAGSALSAKALGLLGALNVAGTYSAGTTEFGGSGQTIPALPYDTVKVSGSAALGASVSAAWMVVGGNLPAGQLDLGGHRLSITGNVVVDTAGRLVMTAAADSLTLGGDFYTSGRSSYGALTAGYLQIGGNFTQMNTGPVYDGFAATGTHVTRFTGGTHTFAFATPDTGAAGSHFAQLVVDGGATAEGLSKADVQGDLTVTGATVRDTINTAAEIGRNWAPVFVTGNVVADASSLLHFGDLQVNGTLTAPTAPSNYLVRTTTFTGAGQTIPVLPYTNLTVTGSAAASANLTLAGALFIGDASRSTGVFDPAGHTIVVDSSLTTAASGVLLMTSTADSVDVGANTYFAGGNETGKLTAGTLVLRGAFNQSAPLFFPQGNDSAFVATGTHRTVMVGIQGLSFYTPHQGTRFNRLTLADTSGVTINTGSSPLVVGDTLHIRFGQLGGPSNGQVIALGPIVMDSGASLTVDTVDVGATLAVNPLATYDVPTTRFTGTGQNIPLLSAPYRNLDILGTVTLGNNVYAFDYVHVTGQLTLNGHLFEADSAFATQGAGTVVMTNPNDTLRTLGTATFAGGSTAGLLTAGVVQAPNFLQDGTNSPSSFAASGSHRLELISNPNGTGEQITFGSPGAGASHPQNLMITGNTTIQLNSDLFVVDTFFYAVGDGTVSSPAGTKVTVVGPYVQTTFNNLDVDTLELRNNGTPIVNPNSYSFWAPKFTRFTGANQVLPDSIAFHTVEVTGSVQATGTQGSADTMYVNGGSLRVGPGNFGVNGDFQTLNGGTLTMTDPSALLFVTGNATFGGGSTGSSLTAGEIQVGGSFTELATSSPSDFAPLGTKVVLNGTTQQTVSFASPVNSYFRDLDVFNTGGVFVKGQLHVLSNFTSSQPINGDTLAVYGTATDTSTSFAPGISLRALLLAGPLATSAGGTYSVARTHFLATNSVPALPYTDLVINAPVSSIASGATISNLYVAGPGAPLYQGTAGSASFTVGANRTFQLNGVDVQQGNLTLGGGHLLADSTLTIGAGGTLTMDQASDSLEVVRTATFAGNSTAGLLTAGTLILDGDLSQAGDPAAFAPSGTHLTVFTQALRSSGVTHAISFSNPTTSAFQDLREDSPDTLTIFNGEADVRGRLTVTHGVTTQSVVIRSGLGNALLRFGTADVHAATFDTVTAQFMRADTLVAFDSVTFNAPTDNFTQFVAVGHNADTLTISNPFFTTIGSGTGNYISAINLDGTGLFTVLGLFPNVGSAEFTAHILPDTFSTIVWDVP